MRQSCTERWTNGKWTRHIVQDCNHAPEALGKCPKHDLGPNYLNFGIVEHPAAVMSHRLSWQSWNAEFSRLSHVNQSPSVGRMVLSGVLLDSHRCFCGHRRVRAMHHLWQSESFFTVFFYSWVIRTFASSRRLFFTGACIHWLLECRWHFSWAHQNTGSSSTVVAWPLVASVAPDLERPQLFLPQAN